MRDYRSTPAQRLASEIRYLVRYETGDILAGIATMCLLVLLPIIVALGR